MRATMRPLGCLGLAVVIASLPACGNPVADVRIEALGPEAEGVPEGEYHRPGQPCVLCHSAYGGAEPEMSIAGTIYAVPNRVPDPVTPTEQVVPPPVDEVRVILYDSFGRSPPTDIETLKSNCVGNFWIPKDQWEPFYPLYAEVQFTLPGTEQTLRAAMGTWIQREGSCNACHDGDRNQGSAGRIYCMKTMPDPPFEFPTSADCGGVPQ